MSVDEHSMTIESGSVVDLIKQDMDEISRNREVFIPIPGYDTSGLSIKFRLADPGEINVIATKTEKQFPKKEQEFQRNMAAARDSIILFCEGFYVQPDGVDQPVMLDPEETGIPMRFDARLAKLIGAPEDATARQILDKLFRDNESKIISFAEKLNRWQTNEKADVSKELWETGG